MNVTIRELTAQDYNEVVALWQTAEEVGLSEADSEEHLARFLECNPGLSFVARDGTSLVGTILCGHDGRRGYIYHLVVSESHRRKGIGRALVDRSVSALESAGIRKCHTFVFGDNVDGLGFWKATGWTQRAELTMLSRRIPTDT